MKQIYLWISGLAIIVLAAIAGLYLYPKQQAAPQQVVQTQRQAAAESAAEKEEAGLGSDLYESGQNPVKDKLPETNPFQTKINPFEE